MIGRQITKVGREIDDRKRDKERKEGGEEGRKTYMTIAFICGFCVICICQLCLEVHFCFPVMNQVKT